MNLRRAGVLKNRSRTATLVPRGCGAGETRGAISRPSATTRQPLAGSSETFENSSSRETELIEASASPRKPRLATPSRSSRLSILLVACRDSASGRSSSVMPQPLSRTRISRAPPPSSSSSMRVLPASMAFSTSSLTTEAGRSTTSPAAIWLARRGLRIRIRRSPGRAGCMSVSSSDIDRLLDTRAKNAASLKTILSADPATASNACRNCISGQCLRPANARRAVRATS